MISVGHVFLLLLVEVVLLGADQVPVLAGEPHGLAAVAVDESDDLLVHGTHEDHLDDRHGFLVGDAHALDELRLLAELLQDGADLGTAAVDDDGVDPDVLHHDDVQGKELLQLVIHHGMAAVLDDDRLVVETADVRQRLEKNLRPFLGT